MVESHPGWARHRHLSPEGHLLLPKDPTPSTSAMWHVSNLPNVVKLFWFEEKSPLPAGILKPQAATTLHFDHPTQIKWSTECNTFTCGWRNTLVSFRWPAWRSNGYLIEMCQKIPGTDISERVSQNRGCTWRDIIFPICKRRDPQTEFNLFGAPIQEESMFFKIRPV